MKVVHFIASVTCAGDTSCCGWFEPQFMSGDWRDVTCGSCKRGRRYRAAKGGAEMFMTDYKQLPVVCAALRIEDGA